MDSFGNQLKQERKRRKVSLDDIARLTKIRVRYLQALEDGQHERLPGIVFAKGYVRAYAETIGADADRLVDAYVEEQRSLGRLETEASQENVLEALAAAVERDKKQNSRRGATGVLIGAVLLVAALAVVWFGIRPLFHRGPAAPAEIPAVADTRPATSLPQQDEAGANEPPIDRVEPVAAGATSPQPAAAGATSPQPAAAGATKPDDPPAELATARAEPELPVTASVAPAVPSTSAALSIPDYGVGTGVRRRTLVGEASEFETGTRAVFWTRVLNGESGSLVRHVWMHEGNETFSIDLSIGASHWRTYSKQTLLRAGNWTVEARDEEGRLLARQRFVATDARR